MLDVITIHVLWSDQSLRGEVSVAADGDYMYYDSRIEDCGFGFLMDLRGV